MPTIEPWTDEFQANLGCGQVLGECLACAIIVVDAKGKITGFNSQAEALTSVAAANALKGGWKLLPPVLLAIIQETFATGVPGLEQRFSLKTPDGSVRQLSASTMLTHLAGGKNLAQAIVVVNDLTSVRQLEENIRRLDRLASIGTLSASMAHEIKNALVAGKTFIDLLLEKHQDADLADVVRREIHRIDSIVSQMLRFSGAAKTGFSAVSLHEIIDHSLRLVRPQLEGKSIVLTQSFEAGLDLVKGDDYQLQQAFVNLFLNSLEAMAPHGTLSVATEAVPASPGPARSARASFRRQVRVTVKDNGAGIPPEHLDRLFEPFFTTKQHGTGLGLPITRRIIQEHGGAISVQSEPDKGASFTIVLPSLNQA